MSATQLAVDGLRNLLVRTYTQPDATAARLAELDRVLAEDDAWYARLEAAYEGACTLSDEGDDADGDAADGLVRSYWETACEHMTAYQELRDQARTQPRGRFRRRFVAAMTERIERLADLMRTMSVVWDDLNLDTPDEIHREVWTFRIPPGAYLRSMWNLYWSAILHPRSTTTVDLMTGRVVRRV